MFAMAGIRRHVSQMRPAGLPCSVAAAAAAMPDVVDGRSSRCCITQRSGHVKPFRHF